MILPIYVLVMQGSGSTSTEVPKVGQPSLDDYALLNSTTALKYGFKGVVILNRENEAQTAINTVQGVDNEIIITAKFLSYDPKVTEAYLKLDPTNSSSSVEKGLGDGKGTIRLNDFIRYDEKSVKLPANEEVKIKLIINIPLGTPHTYIPLAPVGISSEYPIISNIVGDVNV